MPDLSGEKPIAFITGASSGLGVEFAHQLAACGYDLVLIARREELLKSLIAKLHERHGTSCDILVADLSEPSGIADVEGRMTACPRLDMLVNNAGFGTNGLFHEVSVARHEDMVNVHILATLRLCHAALPKMLQCGQGDIINVASVAAFLPMVGNVNYAASKAYLVSFSEALQREVREKGVRIQALCPGFTYTGFHDTPEYSTFDRAEVPRSWWMTADEVVAASLRALPKGNPICIPGWRYRLLVMLGRNRYALSLLFWLRRHRNNR